MHYDHPSIRSYPFIDDKSSIDRRPIGWVHLFFHFSTGSWLHLLVDRLINPLIQFLPFHVKITSADTCLWMNGARRSLALQSNRLDYFCPLCIINRVFPKVVTELMKDPCPTTFTNYNTVLQTTVTLASKYELCYEVLSGYAVGVYFLTLLLNATVCCAGRCAPTRNPTKNVSRFIHMRVSGNAHLEHERQDSHAHHWETVHDDVGAPRVVGCFGLFYPIGIPSYCATASQQLNGRSNSWRNGGVRAR